MARVYSSQNGVMRGRIGSTVYRKGQNGTTASQYQPDVRNPKTDAQCIQRAAFATALQAASGLRSIVNHSHRNASGKRANLQRFIKQNAAIIRSIMLLDYAGENVPECTINLKGVSGIQPAPYKVSEGALAFRPTTFAGSGDARRASIAIDGALTTAIATQADYAGVLRLLGMNPGEQLSLIQIISAGVPSGSFDVIGHTYTNYECHVLASRITFVAQIPENFTGTLISEGAFNPALIEAEEGSVVVESSTSETALVLADGRMMSDERVMAAVIVRSALDVNGKYDYSTGIMAAAEMPGEMGPQWAAKSYANGASVKLGDQPFLDNAEESF